MKTKKRNNKLIIVKQTIANLSNKEMLKVLGGYDPTANGRFMK